MLTRRSTFIASIQSKGESKEREEEEKEEELAKFLHLSICFFLFRFNGVRHQYSYMVSHTRHRNDKGDISWVESRLIKIDVSFSELNPLNYDPDKTVQRVVHSPSWQDPNSSKPLSCYLRTPLFVSRQDAKFEDDGHLFSWSFDTEPNSTEQSGLRAYILMFDARNLDLIMRVPMPDDLVVPYSVHSAIFARNPLPLQAAPLNEEDWENSKTILK